MKAIVIYQSQTGFTKRYAEWIAQAAGADCAPLSEAKKKSMDAYEAIVFGGWARAGSITKLGWMKKNMDHWTGKKLIVFCVGASPADSPEIAPSLKRNFTETEWEKINVFYCPGGLNYEKMSLTSNLMMKMFVRALNAKKDKTEDEHLMLKMISASYDISNKQYIDPIIKCLNG